jgi:topoisomerase-4 subunit A
LPNCFCKSKRCSKRKSRIDLEQFIAVKGIKAIGNQLTTDKLKQVNLLESLPYEEILDNYVIIRIKIPARFIKIL